LSGWASSAAPGWGAGGAFSNRCSRAASSGAVGAVTSSVGLASAHHSRVDRPNQAGTPAKERARAASPSRIGEAVGLRRQDCYLPASGWGRLTLEKSRPEVNRRWTDTGSAHGERGLKHRAVEEARRVPIPPELVTILRTHITTFGTAPDGRVFASDRGQPVASTAISDVWAEARTLALTPAQVASPLAGRPYDLRHAAVSLWLAAGVPAPRVAERAGHSVEVLLRVYAKCLDGGEEIANTRIDAALRLQE
jgi:integrase